MSLFDAYHAAVMQGLPDPDLDPQFYRGVPGRRVAAWLIDAVVVLAIGVPLALAFGVLTLGFGLLAFPLILIGVALAYRVATVAGASATWGMRAMGIEYRRFDGARLDPTTAFLHAGLSALALSLVVAQAASMIAMVATRYGQGLPDLVLRTTAINRPAD